MREGEKGRDGKIVVGKKAWTGRMHRQLVYVVEKRRERGQDEKRIRVSGHQKDRGARKK
jgi:hypothetical protein